jgi:hypothetical protein
MRRMIAIGFMAVLGMAGYSAPSDFIMKDAPASPRTAVKPAEDYCRSAEQKFDKGDLDGAIADYTRPLNSIPSQRKPTVTEAVRSWSRATWTTPSPASCSISRRPDRRLQPPGGVHDGMDGRNGDLRFED